MNAHSLAAQPCSQLKGIGPRLAECLAKCGIHNLQDLLFHLPFRYLDRTRLTPIGSARYGDYVAIEAAIELAQIKFGKRRSLFLRLRDATGAISMRLFYFTKAQEQALQVGMTLRCFGEVRHGPLGKEMVHPEYRLVDPNQINPVEETLTPIYPTTQGLQQTRMRQLTSQALVALARGGLLDEFLPSELLQQFQLHDLATALQLVHRPPPDAAMDLLLQGKHPAQQRLAFEELLAHQLCLRRLRQLIRQQPAPSLPVQPELTQQLLAQLSFSLTEAQQRVITEIQADLSQSQPMLRLVQGDVGCGKTIVAAIAALQAIGAGFQVVLMAPTELLAEQHYQKFVDWFGALNIQVAWLAAKMPAASRREMLASIANGSAKIAIGTHALMQQPVEYNHLALVIIDEQHRFGVEQRYALREKGMDANQWPHQLVLTATPIPRTLAMTAYAELDISVIDQLPPGRTPVKTVALPNSKRDEVIQRIRTACGEGRQAYWVCTLIEASESLQCQAAEDTANDLIKLLPEFNIGLVHGRLKPTEKHQVMQAFKAGEYHCLVATTVIEVGVDVPNASLMIVENAERLGLSQLHQLRGRVGRGAIESFCVLLYQAPLSYHGKARLQVMRDTTDGFVIAQKDLQLRGPGELLGTRQTGLAQLKVADLIRDRDLLKLVRQAAKAIVVKHPEIVDPLIQRWVATGESYGRV